jgi:hypothetical protein
LRWKKGILRRLRDSEEREGEQKETAREQKVINGV